ncbi:unnamed protein product [Acanthoscelides obtectus]|uniref:Uncharacterized protein n=1 Tax=Acanthoscelides obtectus TaxID=200917 RepID=A0A9P0P9Q4_ACAOB|nr:unnamed protein product [Acanthoscelides obtectus]CAK1627689.1 hypothetical protein AOBTE_LOCUS4767 [Acanthoscelides obtectus]
MSDGEHVVGDVDRVDRRRKMNVTSNGRKGSLKKIAGTSEAKRIIIKRQSNSGEGNTVTTEEKSRAVPTVKMTKNVAARRKTTYM